MKSKYLFIWIAFLVFGQSLYASNNLFAQDSIKTCADCHADLVGKKRKHAPVEESCENCHSATGVTHPGESKGFELADRSPALCFYCHEAYEQKNIHAPVEMGECSACHETHSSENRSLLLVSKEKLCFECHDSDLKKGKSIHAPVEMNSCEDCHTAHESEYKSLLVADKSTLCFNCHDNVQGEITSKHPHAVAVDDCFTCHFSHSSE